MPEYTEDDCINETQAHIDNVIVMIYMFLSELELRAERHDESKLQDPELSGFVKWTPKLKESTYGSDEYKGFLKEMKVFLDHHYQHNRHHPEHFQEGVSGMNLIDIIEMFCDWCAATKRHNDGDIFKSIEINQKRFDLSPQLAEIFKNTAKALA